MVILPNENQHRFHYQGEAATVIQPVDSRVNDFIRKQIRKGCRVQKDIQSRTEYFVKETIFNGRKTKESKKKFPLKHVYSVDYSLLRKKIALKMIFFGALQKII